MRGKFLKNRKMQYIMSFMACILVVHFAGLVAKADGVDMELVYRGYTAESGGLDKASQGGDSISAEKESLTALKMMISKPENENEVSTADTTQASVADVTYSVYSAEADWSPDVKNNSIASSGDNPIKAIKVQISGTATTNYNVEYRVMYNNDQWSKWCSNGEVAGNTYGTENIIGVQAKIVAKQVETVAPVTDGTGSTPSTNDGFVADTGTTDAGTTAPAPSNTTSNGEDAINAFVKKCADEVGQGPDASGVTKYGQWYQDNVDGSQTFKSAKWCAMFLSWCANQAGISKSTVGYYAACSYWQEQFFVPNGLWHAAKGYTPAKGDIIFFDYTGDGKANHNGIVESVSATQVVAIEGNVDKKVARCTYSLSDVTIIGYGKPDYSKNAVNVEADKKNQQNQQNEVATGGTDASVTASGQAEKIVQIALNEEGNKGKNGRWTKYGQWYADNIAKSQIFANNHWCAMFVSWCANQAGVSNKVIKPYASCAIGVSDFQSMGVWHSRSSGYKPKKGDVIFFTFSHTGLVDYVDSNGYVHTIEGNSSNAVQRRSYNLGYGSIKGYGSPKYN